VSRLPYPGKSAKLAVTWLGNRGVHSEYNADVFSIRFEGIDWPVGAAMKAISPRMDRNGTFMFSPSAPLGCPYCGSRKLDIEFNEDTGEKQVLTCTCMDCRRDFYADLYGESRIADRWNDRKSTR